MALKLYFDRHNMYIYPWYISDLTATKDLKQVADINVPEVFAVIEKDYFKMYHDSEASRMVGYNIFQKILKDHDFFKKVIQKIYNYSDKLLVFCRQIPTKKNLENLTDSQLLKIYEQYLTKLSNLRAWGWVPVFLDGMEVNFLSDYINTSFYKFLKTKNQEDKLADYYSILSSTDKASEVQRESIARLKLLKKILLKHRGLPANIKVGEQTDFSEKYPDVYRLIKKHLQDFGWLTYSYVGPTMSEKYLFNAFKADLEAGDVSQQIKQIEGYYKNIKKEKKALIKKLNLSSDLVYFFEVSSELMFIKDYRKGVYQQSYVLMDKVIDEIARRLNFSTKQVKYLVGDEIKKCFESKKIDWKPMINQRLEKCAYRVTNGQIKVWQGREANDIIKKKLEISQAEDSSIDIKELKGMVAYSGKVRGIVKIVLVQADVPKIKTGDILVSSATNPDLILAMKKAAAFVTDTGGIISHAAIVARELKKPCIVGTKIATKVLKDGDFIEVDANRGIVRIIK